MSSAGEPPVASVEELLREAAAGRVGVDRDFLKRILDTNDPAAVLRFAHSSRDEADFRIDLDPLLADLLRHYGRRAQPDQDLSTNDAGVLEFYLDLIRRDPENVDEGLIQALLPFGPHAVAPLLELYEELGEEQGSDIAFLLAALRARDPRVLDLLIDRLEYDAADGAFCLGLYGDPAARPALERILAEVPADNEENVELRREIQYAIDQLGAPEPQYEPEHFDIYAEYPKRALPAYDLLEEGERLALFTSPEADVRAGAAHSFFNQELSAQARAALIGLAHSDPEASVRGEGWASLGDAANEENAESAKLRDEMIAVLSDQSRPAEERGGAAVGLYAVADRDDVRRGLEALYEEGGKGRVKALEAMWRSLWQPYAKFFGRHLDANDPENKDPALVRQALRGAGYFRLTAYIDKMATFFDREEPYDDLREDALFAYALAMPGETTRGRVKGMLRKIDELTGLSQDETDLVQFALDERLRLQGLAPVFEAEQEAERDREAHAHPAAAQPEPPPASKPGRNDPCPCGSGKKYKKCHGA